MKKVLVYIFWGNPLFNASSPILSIASFRCFNKETPVFVIDYSNGNWRDFPSKLKFRVISLGCQLKKIINIKDPIIDFGYFRLNNLSRPFDIDYLADYFDDCILVYADTDIFFLKNPFPLENEESDDFHCCKDNSGFFYFKNKSLIARDFLNQWKEKTIFSIYNKNYREELLRKSGRNGKNELFHDEIICCSLNYDYYNEIIYNVRISKNKVPFVLMPESIHLMHVHWGKNKGVVSLIISETRKAILNCLSVEDVKIATNGIFPRINFNIMDIKKENIRDIKKLVNNLI